MTKFIISAMEKEHPIFQYSISAPLSTIQSVLPFVIHKGKWPIPYDIAEQLLTAANLVLNQESADIDFYLEML